MSAAGYALSDGVDEVPAAADKVSAGGYDLFGCRNSYGLSAG